MKLRIPALILCFLMMISTAVYAGETAQTQSGSWGITFQGTTQKAAEVIAAASTAPQFQPTDEAVTYALVSGGEIKAAMENYGLEAGSASAKALHLINSKYAATLTEDQRNGTLVFLFEGAGESSDPAERLDAMCVVVREGAIVYVSTACSTIPDSPFVPWKNDGMDVPTLKSGIYAFDTVNHNGIYGALRVREDQVVRFASTTEFYETVSNQESIQVHRRNSEETSTDREGWANSVGCLLVGHAGAGVNDNYAQFAHAVGITQPGTSGYAPYSTDVEGTLIVDRSLGGDYLRAVGYTDEALALIG